MSASVFDRDGGSLKILNVNILVSPGKKRLGTSDLASLWQQIEALSALIKHLIPL